MTFESALVCFSNRLAGQERPLSHVVGLDVWLKVTDSCPAHVNEVELRAILQSFVWRTWRTGGFKCKFMHLTESQATLGVATKSRSSSYKLQPTIARLNAVTLAADIYPSYGFLVSEDNPSDKPSRCRLSR